jgi:hypothetical protein
MVSHFPCFPFHKPVAYKISWNFPVSRHKIMCPRVIHKPNFFSFPEVCGIQNELSFSRLTFSEFSLIKWSDTLLSPLFQNFVCCMVLSYQRLINPVIWLYRFSASLFQDSVWYEMILHINNTIVSSGRPSNLHDNFLPVFKNLNSDAKFAFLLCFNETDNFHFCSVKNISG